MEYLPIAVAIGAAVTIIVLSAVRMFPRSYSVILGGVNRLLLLLLLALVTLRYAHELALVAGVQDFVLPALELAIVPFYSALLLVHVIVNRHYFTAPIRARCRNSRVGKVAMRKLKIAEKIFSKTKK